jgi:hypothetical protein
MQRMMAALALMLVLPACGSIQFTPPPVDPNRPLSRLTVQNQRPDAVYLRANWIEGMEQTSVIPVGDPLFISGSIAGAFPATVEILDAGCNPIIGRLTDQPWDLQAVITISETGLSVEPITTAEGFWDVAQTVAECRTKPDLP